MQSRLCNSDTLMHKEELDKPLMHKEELDKPLQSDKHNLVIILIERVESKTEHPIMVEIT